jgi:hypothetical protein
MWSLFGIFLPNAAPTVMRIARRGAPNRWMTNMTIESNLGRVDELSANDEC